jgi:predicted transport protein
LGWNTADPDEVDREFKVYDGTFLDYALRIDGAARLFVEAKALGKSLEDKPFIAQTVNYANNEGVVWCVLTNGVVYRVYKSNEPVAMNKKLLLEIDLRDAANPDERQSVLRSLNVLSREAVGAGELDTMGEAVFTDVRARAALTHLAAQPTSEFLAVVSGAIEGPKIPSRQLRASLERILGGSSASAGGALVGTPPVEAKPPAKQDSATTPPTSKATGSTGTKKAWTLDYHLAKKPANIVDLYERAQALALSMGEDVQVRITKMYIGCFAGKKSFCTFETQKAKVVVYLSIPPGQAQPWRDDVMRDVSDIGHYGMGDTEFFLTAADQFGDLETLIRQSYLLNRK